MQLFEIYRPNPPEGYLEKGTAVEASKPQLQGVIFADGSVVVRWLTLQHSTALFPNWEMFMTVHGHPEYGTQIRWVTTGLDDNDPPHLARSLHRRFDAAPAFHGLTCCCATHTEGLLDQHICPGCFIHGVHPQ